MCPDHGHCHGYGLFTFPFQQVHVLWIGSQSWGLAWLLVVNCTCSGFSKPAIYWVETLNTTAEHDEYFNEKQRRWPVYKENPTKLCIETNKTVQLLEQRIMHRVVTTLWIVFTLIFGKVSLHVDLREETVSQPESQDGLPEASHTWSADPISHVPRNVRRVENWMGTA
jgi:hypothetical protein